MSMLGYTPESKFGKTIKFESPTKLEIGDIVWVRWKHFAQSDLLESAIPTRITTVYADGNILHQKEGYSGREFAWARDIFAKSPGLPIRTMPYRRMPIADILAAIYKKERKEAT